MPAVSYKEFSGGLDRRLPIGVQDSNRLWVLQNAFITSGKKIEKRPGLKVVATGMAGTKGLENINGRLTVFAEKGTGAVAPAGVQLVLLDPYTGPGIA